MASWKVAEAKARFSELIGQGASEGAGDHAPRQARGGRRRGERMGSSSNTQESLVEFLNGSPLRGSRLEIERPREPPRESSCEISAGYQRHLRMDQTAAGSRGRAWLETVDEDALAPAFWPLPRSGSVSSCWRMGKSAGGSARGSTMISRRGSTAGSSTLNAPSPMPGQRSSPAGERAGTRRSSMPSWRQRRRAPADARDPQ